MQTALFLIVLLSTEHVGIDCSHLRWLGEETGRASQNQKVLEITQEVIEISGLEIPVTVCDSDAGLAANTVPITAIRDHDDEQSGGRRAYLHVPGFLVRAFSDDALRGAVAHELAHLVVPPNTTCQSLPFRLDPVKDEEYLSCQSPADLKAVEWVGPRPVIAMLEGLQAVVDPYIGEEDRGRIRRIIPLRIQAVRDTQ